MNQKKRDKLQEYIDEAPTPYHLVDELEIIEILQELINDSNRMSKYLVTLAKRCEKDYGLSKGNCRGPDPHNIATAYYYRQAAGEPLNESSN